MLSPASLPLAPIVPRGAFRSHREGESYSLVENGRCSIEHPQVKARPHPISNAAQVRRNELLTLPEPSFAKKTRHAARRCDDRTLASPEAGHTSAESALCQGHEA